jgi:hypothetical protein
LVLRPKKKISQDLKTREGTAKKRLLGPVLTRFNYKEMSVERRKNGQKKKHHQNQASHTRARRGVIVNI